MYTVRAYDCKLTSCALNILYTFEATSVPHRLMPRLFNSVFLGFQIIRKFYLERQHIGMIMFCPNNSERKALKQR